MSSPPLSLEPPLPGPFSSPLTRTLPLAPDRGRRHWAAEPNSVAAELRCRCESDGPSSGRDWPIALWRDADRPRSRARSSTLLQRVSAETSLNGRLGKPTYDHCFEQIGKGLSGMMDPDAAATRGWWRISTASEPSNMKSEAALHDSLPSLNMASHRSGP